MGEYSKASDFNDRQRAALANLCAALESCAIAGISLIGMGDDLVAFDEAQLINDGYYKGGIVGKNFDYQEYALKQQGGYIINNHDVYIDSMPESRGQHG